MQAFFKTELLKSKRQTTTPTTTPSNNLEAKDPTNKQVDIITNKNIQNSSDFTDKELIGVITDKDIQNSVDVGKMLPALNVMLKNRGISEENILLLNKFASIYELIHIVHNNDLSKIEKLNNSLDEVRDEKENNPSRLEKTREAIKDFIPQPKLQQPKDDSKEFPKDHKHKDNAFQLKLKFDHRPQKNIVQPSEDPKDSENSDYVERHQPNFK